jgi:SAM-dependent methyltransferase
MQTLTTLDQLDEKLAECDAAAKISDAALRKMFTSFRMDFSLHVPADPFSDEYREAQMNLYRRLAGVTYHVSNEKAKFDVAAADRRPFPYSSGSAKTAGFFSIGVGLLLQAMSLAPGARILELGAGWGNTTIALALTGFHVTAVDVESDFCDLLKLRAKRHEVDITVIHDDFMWAESVSEPYNAAVFFECFHHCSDHMRLLRALQKAIKPGGRIYFGAEPIVGDFPIPWGLRMDGESLWAIRNLKWLELGFNESYFREALSRTGWTAVKHVIPGPLQWATVWEAMRPAEVDAEFLAARKAAARRPLLSRVASRLRGLVRTN